VGQYDCFDYIYFTHLLGKIYRVYGINLSGGLKKEEVYVTNEIVRMGPSNCFVEPDFILFWVGGGFFFLWDVMIILIGTYFCTYF
jgi:hypothetical protein